MRKLLSSFLLFITLAALAQQQLAAPQYVTDPQQIESKRKPDLQNLSIEKLYTTRSVGDSDWSPDSKQVVFVANLSGRNNLWLVPATGGWPMQLTISDQRQSHPAWSPDGAYIAYQSDYGGNEQWDIFLVALSNGDVLNLTDSAEIAEQNPSWSPDGKKLAYEVKPKTASSYEIDLLDIATRKTTHLTQGTVKALNNTRPLWSPDGKWIAYTQRNASGKFANVLVVELASGKAVNLTEHTTEKTYEAAAWTRDGKQLLITSNARNGFDNVALLDVASRRIDWLTNENWEMQAGGVSPDGRWLVWTANIDGNTEIFIYDRQAKKAEQLPLSKGLNDLGGADTPFSHDGRLLFYRNAANAPNDAWVYEIGAKRATQVTHSLVAGLRGEDMVEPYLVRFPSRDGKFQISAFVYVPYNQSRDHKTPAIVYVHGGPSSQSRNSFIRIVQYMVNQGYMVIAPNFRGSSGYGKAFMDANRLDVGGGDLQDVLAATDFLKQTKYVDPKKLIVMGGSYGGYMTMTALSKAPDVWAAGVALVPLVNWETLMQGTDPFLQQYVLSLLGDPAQHQALWKERSPIHFADQIKAPVLLLAGGKDPRCPKAEAEQIADAIKKRGGVVQLKIYENEGHGFARIENQLDAYKRVSDFLKVQVPAPGCHAGGECSVFE